jgi:predicted DNA-binding transcriptional regulator AlpA
MDRALEPARAETLSIVSEPVAEAVFSPEELCAFARISLDTLQRYRRLKKGPREINIGVSVRFLRSDAIEWLKSLRSEAA